MLGEVKRLLGRAEALVTGLRPELSSPVAPSIADGLWRVPIFIISGMEGLWRALLWGLVFGLGWFAVLFILTSVIGSNGPPVSVVRLVVLSMTLGVGSIVLDTPSGLVSRNVKASAVAELAAHIDSCATCDGSMRLLKEGVAIAEASVSRRLSFVSWVLGLLWAFVAWLSVNWVFDLDASSSLRGASLPWALGGGLVLLMLLIVFSCYREAHRTLSQTVAFSFLQVEADRIRARHALRTTVGS